MSADEGKAQNRRQDGVQIFSYGKDSMIEGNTVGPGGLQCIGTFPYTSTLAGQGVKYMQNDSVK